MREILNEIITSMMRHKTRIILTGISMGWGIFILVMFLGTGRGVVNGFNQNIGLDTLSAIHITPGRIQIPWQDMERNRPVRVTMTDLEDMHRQMSDEMNYLAATARTGAMTVVGANQHVRTELCGMTDNYLTARSSSLHWGEAFSASDYEHCAEVCLISRLTAEILFGSPEAAIGQHINAEGITYRVKGVYTSNVRTTTTHLIYIPLATALKLYHPEGELSDFVIGSSKLRSEQELKALEDKVFTHLSERLHFSPSDHAALTCKNYSIYYTRLMSIVDVANEYIWIVGLASLLASIISISNIISVSVFERRKELGIRLVMGATDREIFLLVIGESVMISLLFGYLGMLIGIWLLRLMDYVITDILQALFFVHPQIDFMTVIYASIFLLLAGLTSGMIPAIKAIRISPVKVLQ